MVGNDTSIRIDLLLLSCFLGAWTARESKFNRYFDCSGVEAEHGKASEFCWSQKEEGEIQDNSVDAGAAHKIWTALLLWTEHGSSLGRLHLEPNDESLNDQLIVNLPNWYLLEHGSEVKEDLLSQTVTYKSQFWVPQCKILLFKVKADSFVSRPAVFISLDKF